MAEKPFDTVAINYTIDAGLQGVVDESEHNPLFRALASLFTTGKPFPKLANTFIVGDDEILRWFGVFVESSGDRVVFFPGFADPIAKIAESKTESPHESAFELDHITLERNRRKFHVTSALSNRHVAGPSTLRLDDHSILWVGISARAFECFRPVAQETRLFFDCPSGDGERRRTSFQRAISGQISNTLRLAPDASLDSDNSFLHFAVYVGSGSVCFYSGIEIAAPYGNPFLTKALPHRLRSHVRKHLLPLSTKTAIQVTACRIPGGLAAPFTLTGPIGGQVRPSDE
jgi:hypothetical protein